MEHALGLSERVRRSGEGKTKGAAYDTAWTARVLDENEKPLFPECVQWLVENQKQDGSWGSHLQNYHDRVLSTLSAVIALKEIGGDTYDRYIQRGETYIWENLKNVELDKKRLIGSELLIPSLMDQAESLELNLPYHVRIYEKECLMKLKKIDELLWYSPLTTLSFSLEFLGDNVDRERLAHVQLANGSVGNSPAATAFFLKHTKDSNAFMYLEEILSITGNGSVMTVYPIEVFEYGWTMYNLMLARLRSERYKELCDFLFKNLRQSGLGPSTESPLTDADDTAIACKVLYDMGYPLDFRIFDAYDAGDYYLTFPFEMDPSISTNVHMLDLVKSCPEFPDRDDLIEKLIRFLKKEMHCTGFWMDKWHVSPYYPTSHAVFALYDIDPSLTEKTVSWMLDTQNENGSWGGNGGTLEETAYALQALLLYHQRVDCIDIDNISKILPSVGCTTLTPSDVSPELWIGKVLYVPLNVVLSSIVSVSIMYSTTIWNLCSGWYV